MIKVNLLPPEIVERRKYERFFPIVFIIVGVLVGLVILTWAGMQFLVASQEDTLAQTQQDTAALDKRAQSLSIFEAREKEVAAKKEAATAALAGRIDMGALAEEVTYVMPDTLWTSRFLASETDGFAVDGYSPTPFGTDVDEGYKAIASFLVRLSSLPAMYDVWLDSAETATFSEFQSSVETSGGVDVLTYSVTSKLSVPPTATAGGQ